MSLLITNYNTKKGPLKPMLRICGEKYTGTFVRIIGIFYIVMAYSEGSITAYLIFNQLSQSDLGVFETTAITDICNKSIISYITS